MWDSEFDEKTQEARKAAGGEEQKYLDEINATSSIPVVKEKHFCIKQGVYGDTVRVAPLSVEQCIEQLRANSGGCERGGGLFTHNPGTPDRPKSGYCACCSSDDPLTFKYSSRKGSVTRIYRYCDPTWKKTLEECDIPLPTKTEEANEEPKQEAKPEEVTP